MKITVLGLGKMGHAIASRLIDREHSLTVWNRSAGKADDLVAKGAIEERSAAQAAAVSEVVI